MYVIKSSLNKNNYCSTSPRFTSPVQSTKYPMRTRIVFWAILKQALTEDFEILKPTMFALKSYDA